jgi:hypothetical protein
MPRLDRDFIVNAIRTRSHFTASGHMSGRSGGGLAYGHRLRGDLLAEYRDVLADGSIRYTVYSYETPIAWVTADGTVRVPDVYYTRTTSGQQNLAREALG